MKCAQRALSAGIFALGVCASALASDSSSSIDPRKVFTEKLVKVNQGGGKAFIHSPHIKVFNVEGKLVAQGLPASFGDLTPDANVAKLLSGQQQGWTASQEAKALGVSLPVKGQTLLVVYAIQPCPPCEGMVAPLAYRLQSHGKGKLHIHRVTIDS